MKPLTRSFVRELLAERIREEGSYFAYAKSLEVMNGEHEDDVCFVLAWFDQWHAAGCPEGVEVGYSLGF